MFLRINEELQRELLFWRVDATTVKPTEKRHARARFAPDIKRYNYIGTERGPIFSRANRRSLPGFLSFFPLPPPFPSRSPTRA